MAVNGSAPKFTARMSKNGVPFGGILLTFVIGLFGVVLNAITPSEAFEIVLNIAALGILAAWATIVACQLRLYYLAKAGTTQRPSYQMPWAPYSGYVTLAFLAGVVVLMALDAERGVWIITALVVAGPALAGGWFLVRDRVNAVAADVAAPAGGVSHAPEPDPDDRPPTPANPVVG